MGRFDEKIRSSLSLGGMGGPFSGIQVRLMHDGTLFIGPSVWEFGRNQTPKIGPLKHEAVKTGDAFNKVMVIVRGRQAEVYVNDISVCDPLVLNRDITPAILCLLAFGPEGTLTEFERFTVWSAEGYAMRKVDTKESSKTQNP